MADIAYPTADVDDLTVFYREAGAPDAPTLVLLHGFPSASHMFRELIPLLAGRFHLVAPDLPGFGYTFEHLTDVTGRLTKGSASTASRCTYSTTARRSDSGSPPGTPSASPRSSPRTATRTPKG
jgi:pimeloyl-ACP methyl ester carboxylesterase